MMRVVLQRCARGRRAACRRPSQGTRWPGARGWSSAMTSSPRSAAWRRPRSKRASNAGQPAGCHVGPPIGRTRGHRHRDAGAALQEPVLPEVHVRDQPRDAVHVRRRRAHRVDAREILEHLHRRQVYVRIEHEFADGHGRKLNRVPSTGYRAPGTGCNGPHAAKFQACRGRSSLRHETSSFHDSGCNGREESGFRRCVRREK